MNKAKKTAKNNSISFIVADKWFKLKVIKGKGKGKKLGFPTINLKLPNTKHQFTNLPTHQLTTISWGVYLCQVVFAGTAGFNRRSQTKLYYYQGILYYGPKLTFKGKKPVLEIYLLDFNKKIKPETEVKFKLLKYLRKPIRFKDENSLIKQIRKDVKKIKRLKSL